MFKRRTRQILIGVTFCVTFCGIAVSAIAPFAVSPVEPTAEQNRSIALEQARARCEDSLADAVQTRLTVTRSEAREIARTRCELMFVEDPISKLTAAVEKT